MYAPKRAAADKDEERASRLAELAAFVPHWLFSTAGNVRLADEETTTFGVANKTALHRRVDAWTQALHRKFRAMKAWSIIRTDAATGTLTRAEDAIRNLLSLLERQAANNTTPPPPARTMFDAFPPPTKQLILFASEDGPDGRVRTRPIAAFDEILLLSNVVFVQNQMNHFLQHTKGLDVQIPTGLCVAIRTGSFTSGATDRPGAFSLYCCGPQVIEETKSGGGRDANEQTSSLMQMQLRTTDTTTGLSDKDIKHIPQYKFTIPNNYFELA